jgi:hypothetical protein
MGMKLLKGPIQAREDILQTGLFASEVPSKLLGRRSNVPVCDSASRLFQNTRMQACLIQEELERISQFIR